MKKLCSVLLAFLLIFGTFSVLSHADFGDFGGDSDYGDFGGYDFDNDYDYDYDDDDDYDYDDYDDDDDDYNGGYYFGGFGDSGGVGNGGRKDDEPTTGSSILGLLIVLFIVYLVLRRTGLIGSIFNRRKRPASVREGGAAATDRASLRSMNEYLTLDPDFSQDQFREKLSNMYVQFQNAWTAKDMTPLRPYLTDAMYAKFDRQLNSYRINKQTNYVDRIAVLDVQLQGFRQEAGMDVIVARLKTRIVDYVLSDTDGRLVRGDQNVEKFMEYEWSLVRTSGQKTSERSGTQAMSCPHCGAPIEINQSAVCEYCGSVLTTDTFDWAVSEIKGLAQRTGK